MCEFNTKYKSISQKKSLGYISGYTSGYTIVELLVVSGVGFIVLFAFLAFLSSVQKGIYGSQARVASVIIQNSLVLSLTNEQAIINSLADLSAGNVALKNCLIPSGSSCVATVGTGFYLYDVTGAKIAGSGSAAPLLYDETGGVCIPPKTNCLFEVFTEFQAACPSGESPCADASIVARFTIRQNPLIKAFDGLLRKPIVSSNLTIVLSSASHGDQGTLCGSARYPGPGCPWNCSLDVSSSCQGYDVYNSCPPGYKRVLTAIDQYSGAYWQYFSCAKL